MALGLAHLFGYHLAPNFNLPFLSANVSELWRRWHMSLSSWIRDYVFIPLGGSQGTRLQTYRNLLITFTLCGLWHGAGWNFVIWGLCNGVLLVMHSAFRTWCQQRPGVDAALQTAPGTGLRVALTFACFCVVFVIFRCPDLTTAGTMFGRMLAPSAGMGFPLVARDLYLTFAVVALGHFLGHDQRGQRLWLRLPGPVRGLACGGAVTAALLLAPGTSQAFIYFQF
jgi:alginate O-acetyltransferase complex protein AlgI